MKIFAQEPGRLDFLDAARACAALMVVASHGLGACSPGYVVWSRANFDPGRSGVALFLLITGFIISAGLERDAHPGRFWLRRLFRLYPAYWASVALAYVFLCAGLETGPLATDRTADWLINLTMMQGFFGRPDASWVFWTLKIELCIYAGFSLLAAAGLLGRIGWRFGAALVVAYIVLGAVRLLLLHKTQILNDYKFFFLLPFLGVIARRYCAGEIGQKRFYLLLAAQPAVLIGVQLSGKFLYPDEVALSAGLPWLLNWGAAYAVFFILLEARRLRMPAAVVGLGRISYSVYLFHPLVLTSVVALALPAWAGWPLFLAGILAVAVPAYRLLEKSGIEWGRSLERRLFAAKPIPASGTTQAA